MLAQAQAQKADSWGQEVVDFGACSMLVAWVQLIEMPQVELLRGPARWMGWARLIERQLVVGELMVRLHWMLVRSRVSLVFQASEWILVVLA